jgi:F-type H+-transporting ATPase subunit b
VKKVFQAVTMFFALSLALGGFLARAQGQDAANPQQMTPKQQAQTAPHTAIATERMDAPETNAAEEVYRHSASVQWIAQKLHVSTETAAQIFEDFNSGLLILAIVAVLLKKVPGILRRRTETLQKELVEARQATEDADKRLKAIEARLEHLDAEIEEFRQRSERESAEDQKRIHASIEAERDRIVHAAEQEIDAASAEAQRELKRYAAELAIAQARKNLHLSADMDKALIAEFGQALAHERNGGGR